MAFKAPSQDWLARQSWLDWLVSKTGSSVPHPLSILLPSATPHATATVLPPKLRWEKDVCGCSFLYTHLKLGEGGNAGLEYWAFLGFRPCFGFNSELYCVFGSIRYHAPTAERQTLFLTPVSSLSFLYPFKNSKP